MYYNRTSNMNSAENTQINEHQPFYNQQQSSNRQEVKGYIYNIVGHKSKHK